VVDEEEPEQGGPRIPIGFQVTAGVGGVLLLVLVIAALAVAAMMRLTGNAERLDDHYVPYATGLATVELSADDMADDERGFLLTGNASFVDELHARAADVRAAFSSASRAAVTPEQHQAVASASAEFERWAAGVTNEIAEYRAGRREMARDWSLGPGRQMRTRYEVALTAATTRTHRAVASLQAALSSFASQSVAVLLAALILAVATGVAVTIWLIRTVLRPVHSLVELLSGFDDLSMV
jgi:methyl-accepting chemotaxis protein